MEFGCWSAIERMISHAKVTETAFLTSSRCDTRDKVRNSVIRTCRATSPNREISATLVRGCVQNVPRKTGKAGPVSCTHGEAAQKLSKDHVVRLHLRLGLARYRMKPEELSKFDENREAFRVLLEMLPPHPSPV